MIPWTVAHQAPLSMRFSRQEYWSGWPFPSAGDLPDSGIGPRSPALQADSLTSETPGKPLVLNANTLNTRIKRERPPLATTREGLHSNEDPAQPKIN